MSDIFDIPGEESMKHLKTFWLGYQYKSKDGAPFKGN